MTDKLITNLSLSICGVNLSMKSKELLKMKLSIIIKNIGKIVSDISHMASFIKKK